MQKHVNLVDLVKSFPTNISLQNLASIQKRTSPIKFAHFAEKSENGSISNLSTKEPTRKAEGSRNTRVVVRGNVHVLVLKLADPRPYRVLRLRVGEHRTGLEWRFDVRQASRRSGFPRLGLLDVRRRVRVHIL